MRFIHEYYVALGYKILGVHMATGGKYLIFANKPGNFHIHVENAIVIGTRNHFEVTNMYKLFLS